MFKTVIVALFAFLITSSGASAEDGPFVFPVDCRIGESCWIYNYVDLKPGKGVLDYACGTATYDAQPGFQHKGTDIGIQDMAAVRAGVEVRAAAAGVVVGMRDGVTDINVKDRTSPLPINKYCGNGVRLKHAQGLVTQYCHMKKGSIVVKAGEQVRQGQRLGLVGLSGFSAFPHLHFQVIQGKTIVDPFVGFTRKKSCGVGENPLWTDEALGHLPYQPTAIYNAGFLDKKPNFKAISQGLYKSDHFPTTAPALVLWAEFFRVEAGDILTFEIKDHTGQVLHKNSVPIKSNKAHYVGFSGLRLKNNSWEPGTYQGTVSLARKRKTFVVHRKIILQ